MVVVAAPRAPADRRARDGEDEASRIDRLADDADDARYAGELAARDRDVGGADYDRCFAVEPEIAQWFKAQGEKSQKVLAEALRTYAQEHSK